MGLIKVAEISIDKLEDRNRHPYRHPATIGILDRIRNLRQINLGNDKVQRVPGIRNRDRRLYGTRVKSIH